MVFDLYPWRVDIDVESTKKFYEENDLTVDSEITRKFVDSLKLTHKSFFRNLGVNIFKVRVEEIICDEEKGTSKLMVDFLMRGKFLAIAEFQKEIYGNIDEFKNDVKDLEVIDYDFHPYINIDDLGCGIVFKHPASRFESKEFEKWNCGYICGTVII